jgi:hypothetical protein
VQVLLGKVLRAAQVLLTCPVVVVAQVLLAQPPRQTMAAQAAQVYQILSPVLRSLMAAAVGGKATDSQVLRAVQVVAVRAVAPTTATQALRVLLTQAAAQVAATQRQRAAQEL